MRAALLTEYQAPLVVADDVDIEAPGAGEVKVRITHCGVCHSDLSAVDGVFPLPLPVILGHEAAGVVDAVGPGVRAVAPGDKVVLAANPPCGRCPGCARGEWGTCVRVNDLFSASLGDGTTRLSRDGAVVYRGLGVGAFGEYVITPETGAVKVADDTPLDVACVIGCAVQTGVGSVLNTARVEEGSTVLVIGLGGVGMSVVQGARLAGAARIIVSDPIAERREVARSLGATDTIDPTATEVPGVVHGFVDGGVDYAFEVVGRSALVRDCIWSTRSGGTTVMVGAMGLDDPLVIEPAVVFASTERKLLGTLLGSSNSLREVPRLLGLWRAGRLDLEALITMRRPITEVNEAFADLRAGRGIRTVLSF